MNDTPTKEQILQTIQSQQDELRRRGIIKVLLFGSVARGDARTTSDIDLLVEFDHPVGLFEIGGTQAFFEDLLGRPVDLGTTSMLRSELRPVVMQEAVRAA